MKAVSKPEISLVVAILFATVIALAMTRTTRMSPNWVAPYLSAAHNLKFGGDYLINEAECISFNELTEEEQLGYEFEKKTPLSQYNHNPIGYAYLIWVATKVFFFYGDQMAIVLLQLLIHLLLCTCVLLQLKSKKSAFYFFMVLYMVNPLILKFVAFDFYYFWQSVPGLLLIIMLLDIKKRLVYPILFALLFPILLSARMTLALSLAVFFVFIVQRYRWHIPLLASCIFLLLFNFINKPTEKNLWHTVYVGIGAYNNPYVNELSDDEGYLLYEEATGEKLLASIGGNYYDTSTIRKYQEITKSKVIDIFDQNPLLFIKNAALNSLQVFSIGYLNRGGDFLNILSALIGLVILIWLIYLKKYILIVLIAAPSFLFTGFYPPIPAYMFGSYVFLVVGYYFVFKDILNKFSVPLEA
jgi:hypothetical protein